MYKCPNSTSFDIKMCYCAPISLKLESCFLENCIFYHYWSNYFLYSDLCIKFTINTWIYLYKFLNKTLVQSFHIFPNVISVISHNKQRNVITSFTSKLTKKNPLYFFFKCRGCFTFYIIFNVKSEITLFTTLLTFERIRAHHY